MQERMHLPPKLAASRKNKKNADKKTAKNRYFIQAKQLIHDYSTAHELVAHLAEKKSSIDFCHVPQANDDFFSGSHDFRVRPCRNRKHQKSGTAGLPYPSRVTGRTSRHPTGSQRGAHPRACCLAHAAILACCSWRPLTSTSFEFLHPWCDVNQHAIRQWSDRYQNGPSILVVGKKRSLYPLRGNVGFVKTRF